MTDHDGPGHPDDQLGEDEPHDVDDEKHEQADGELHQQENGQLGGCLCPPPHCGGFLVWLKIRSS